MKIVKIIKKIFIGIFAVIFFAFAIVMTVLVLYRNKYGVTQMNKTSLIIINDEISSDKYKEGDLVLVEEKKIDELSVGDEVFAYKVDKDGAVSIDLGAVGEIRPDPDENAIIFKNGSTYTMDYVAGTADKVYNKLGTYLSIIGSRWGFLFIILVPCLLIFIYELYALVIEIKYGKEETAK